MSKFLIHKDTGNVIVSNEHFASSGLYRKMNREELKSRGLLSQEEESQDEIGNRIELAEHFNDLSKSALNKFATKHNLVTSLDVTKSQEVLVTDVRNLVREHNKELALGTEETFLPEGFYELSIKKLKKLASDEGFELDLKGNKKHIQDALYDALEALALDEE